MKTRVRTALPAFRTLTMAWCLVTFSSALPQRRQSNVPFLGDLSVIDCRRPVLAYFPDPDDCRNFYHCSDWTGLQKKSCGNLYFNPQTGVCDWPSTVRRLRPECPSPDVIQAPITNVPKAFQALTTEERETLKIIQLNSNNSPVRFPEQETVRRPVGPSAQPPPQQGFPQNPPTHQVPQQSFPPPPPPPPQPQQPQQVPLHPSIQQGGFERPIAAVLNSQSPPLKTSALPPPPPPSSAAQVVQPQVVAHPQPINQHQVRQPVGAPLPETPRQHQIFSQPEPQQFQPSQPLPPAAPQVQPPSLAPPTNFIQPGPQQFEFPTVGQTLTHQVNPLQQRQPVVEPQPPAPPRGVVILPPAPPPQRFENPEPVEELILVEVEPVEVIPEVQTEAPEPTQIPILTTVTPPPEEKTRSQPGSNLRRRPIHTRVKVENHVEGEAEQHEEEKQHQRARIPISTSRPASTSESNLTKVVKNRFTPPSHRPDIFKTRRPTTRQPEKEKIKEDEEEDSPKSLPKTDFKSNNRPRFPVPKPGSTRGSTESPSGNAFLVCSDDTCFEPNTLEEGGVPDLKPAASARLSDDKLIQIFEQMTIRQNSDSKDDQTIRNLLEIAKERPKEEVEMLEPEELEEEELEVTTQKDEPQDTQESNRSNGSILYKPASDRPSLVLPKKALFSNEENQSGEQESSTSLTGLTEDPITTIVDLQSTTKEFTIEESFTTEETRANREILSSGFSLNTELPVDDDVKIVNEIPITTTELVDEEEQELTTQVSKDEIKVEEEVTNVPEDVVETTQEPLVVEEDLIIVEPVAVILPEIVDQTESTNIFPEKFLEGVPVISPSELEALMNEAVTQDVQEESTQAEVTTAKSEELLTEAVSEPADETTVHSENSEPEVTETLETIVEPEIAETTSTEIPASVELKEFAEAVISHEEEETTTTVQPDVRPPSLSTLESLLSKLNSGDPVDTFLSIMSNFDLSALVSIANNEENKVEAAKEDQQKVIDENGVQVVMPVGWFETPDEYEDETTQVPTTEKPQLPEDKVEETSVQATEASEEPASTTSIPQTTTTFEKVVTITPGQVFSTTLRQEEASTVPPQPQTVDEVKDETTLQPDSVEVVTAQGILVVDGVSVTVESTTEPANADTTLRPDDKRKHLPRVFKPKTRIPVVPASSTSKTVLENHDEEDRSKFNSRNRIRQRLRTLSGTTSASKALEILNDRAKSENGQKAESHSDDEKLDGEQIDSADSSTLPLVTKERTKINVTKLVDRRNELFKKRVPITTSPHPKEDPNLSTSTSQKPLFANPSRRPFRLSSSNAEQQPVSELTANESSTTTTVELSSKQKNIRCRLFRRACNEDA